MAPQMIDFPRHGLSWGMITTGMVHGGDVSEVMGWCSALEGTVAGGNFEALGVMKPPFNLRGEFLQTIVNHIIIA